MRTRSTGPVLSGVLVAAAASLFCPRARADYTNNIMVTGYWAPTNEMVRHFSTNSEQNPGGWQGENWEGRGYNIHSFFPEFPDWPQDQKGTGDFEVDYQDTSADFWRIVETIKPVAIITFSRGNANRSWEIETRQRNLETWIDDYEAPFQPTPAPPDSSVPAGHIRYSTLPVDAIEAAVDAADINVNAAVDRNGFGGGFLSEFMAYHGTWYQSIHENPLDEAWTVAGGHIHVGTRVTTADAIEATHITLRTLTDYLDGVVPAPGSAWVLGAAGALAAAQRRRSER